LGAALALVLLTIFAYQPSFDNEFVDWDDYTYVVENELVRNEKLPLSEVFKKPVSLNYHPLTVWSMRAQNNKCEKCSEGISARPFIVGNVAIHILNVLLVFGLVYYLSGYAWILAALVALWFGVHPMHVESVAWVSERKDVLYSFFFLAAMATYLRYLATLRLGWLGLTLALFVLACLSKAMAVVLPVVMVLLAFWQHKDSSAAASLRAAFAPRRLLEYVPFFGLALFFGLMAVKIQSGQNFMGLLDIPKNTPVAINDFGTFRIMERFHFAAHGYVMYIANLFAPSDLCTFYPYPTRPNYDGTQSFWHLKLLLMLVSLGLAGYWAFFGKKQWQKLYVFGVGFYFITVVLVLQFLSVGLVIMADRYAYLPYFGLLLAFFLPLHWAAKPVQQIGYGLLLAFGLWFIIQTRAQVETWQDSQALWEQVIQTQKSGGNIDHAYSVRGHYFGKMADKAAKSGDGEKVKMFLDKAFKDFEEAVKLGSQKVEVLEGLGNINGMRGNHAEAIKYYEQAIKAKPNKSSLYFNLGVTYGLTQKWKEAANAYNQCDSIGAERPADLYANRSIALINSGQYKESLKDLDWLINNQPTAYQHLTNKGIVLLQLGDKAGATQALTKALQLNPSDALTQQKLQQASQ
jgi:tetratricopeptide (TPR) repeat protein